MKILLLTQEPPLRHDEVVSGNAVRSMQITAALEGAGHEVAQAWLSKARRREDRAREFRSADELQALIARSDAGAILVSFWDLLSLLPYDLSQPVVLDFVAPRPLEELYESPETVEADLGRLRNALRRCDLVLVGNGLQRHLLINTLLEAGFDLRRNIPLAVVPLGARPASTPPQDPGTGTPTLVGGGVDWPWRTGGAWDAALAEAARAGDIRLVLFGGRYRWHAKDDAAEKSPEGDSTQGMPERGVELRGLATYEAFSRFLGGDAHIGLELAEWNIERAYSQSFRSLEFLRHGLPLICNRYLPIADLVEEYDAGWLLREPSELGPLLAGIRADPAGWQRKSAGAARLVEEALSPARTAAPLLEWLEDPKPAERLSPRAVRDDPEPVLGVPPLRQRLARQWGLVRRFGLPRLLGLGRQEKPATESGVLIVTRADLFPPDHGAAVRTLETAHALARDGMRVGIVTEDRRCWLEVTDQGIQSRRFPWWLGLLSLPGPLAKLLHHSKDLPHSNSFLYLPLSDASYFWRILAANRQLPAGVLQAEFPAYANPCLEAAETLRCGVVLVQHNVEYERMRAQVPELTDPQYANLRDLELSLCRRVDAVVCVSDNDRRRLEDDGVNPALLHTVPHGVDLAGFEPPAESGVRERFNIPPGALLLVYHGTYSYPPNREAVRIFAEVLLPGLEELGLEAHLLAVGRDPPSIAPHPRIHFTGSVAQVGPWLKAADIAAVPLTGGGGTRMKILDCFAAALPVVSTGKGIEGIPVGDGKEALIIDDWPEFIRAIERLHRDPDAARALAARGRAFAESVSWDEIARRYRRLYGNIGT